MLNLKTFCTNFRIFFLNLQRFSKHTHKKVACAVMDRTSSWGTRCKDKKIIA